jgi:spore germination protein YaaH
MIVPSIIVYGAGNTSHLKETLNVWNKPQNPPTAQNGQVPLQKPAFTLGWVAGSNPNLQNLAAYKDLNVVSPILATIDDQFNLQVTSNSSEAGTIQAQGKMVWARVAISTDTKSNLHAFLTNPVKVQGVIKQLHQSALQNKWNGINLDIENVDSADRNAFSQFIKQAATELGKSSIILSIDLPPDPNGQNGQAPFDHKVIGKYCKYIIFMGYDQHWSSDPIPGPVTSLSWLNQNLQEFTNTGIPSQKIILGLPAYTRIWEQNQQGTIVKNPAEPIQYVENLMRQDHRQLSWDPALGEYYTSYNVNNIHYKIWLPTEKSFSIYLNLISQYHLAGSAVWNLNLMNSDYWNQLYN